MRVPLFAAAIVCLALSGQTTNVFAASHRPQVKKSAGSDPGKDRRGKKAEQSGTKGFGSICIGCSAQ